MASPAQAETPEDWVGLRIAATQLEAPEGSGGLPEESLQELFRSKQGEPLNPANVRLDLETLFRVGEFSAVEAHVEPWFAYDESGAEVDAVLLTYWVYPAPRVGKVRVVGNRNFSQREVLEWVSVNSGQGPWFPELESQRLAERVVLGLARQGYINADAAVRAEENEVGTLDLSVVITEGQPNILERLSFSGEIEDVMPRADHGRLRKWAKRAGLEEGKPYAREAISRAQSEIRRQLANMQRGPFRQRRGWINARVTPALARTGSGATRLNFSIEPGARLDLNVEGVGRRGQHKVQSALGIDERLRLTRGWLDEAPERMVDWLQVRSYLAASVDLSLDTTDPDNQVLTVIADRGPKHYLGARGSGAFVGVDFQGNEALDDAELQRVLDQVSEDVIRRDFFTEPELSRGLRGCDDLYRARGYLDAQLDYSGYDTTPFGFLPFRMVANPIRRAVGAHPPLRVTPHVAILEGPLTVTDSVEVNGMASEIEVGYVDVLLADMTDHAFSPQQLEGLTRRIVESHREAGYLEVDATVETTIAEPQHMLAKVVIKPGPKLLLRSKVTRGLRRTRLTFVRREVDLERGSPVTSTKLDTVRTDLYDLGIFRTVQLELLGDGTNRDLVIDVTERPRWAYEVGVGLSTDQGIRTFGRITRRNLWGRAHRLDVTGQVGLEYRSAAVNDWLPDPNNAEWRLTVAYTAPRFPLRAQETIFDVVLRERRLERTWRMARTGGGTRIETRLAKDTTLTTGARLETRQLQEVDLGALLPGEPWLVLIEGSVPSLWRVQEQVSAMVIHDRRNDPVSPNRGMLLSVNGSWVPGLPWDRWRTQSNQLVTSSVMSEGRFTGYVPLGGLTLRLSATGSRVWSLNHGVIPLEDRFRLGGTGTLRGFQRDAVGPRNLVSRVDINWPGSLEPLIDYATRQDPDRWVPTGGDASAIGTAELILPLSAIGMPNWDGYAAALFTDIGNVWLLSPDTIADSGKSAWSATVPSLRTGVGVGMRVATPVGPMQIDVASNLQALFSNGAVETLLVTEWEEPPVRVHLSLGAMF